MSPLTILVDQEDRDVVAWLSPLNFSAKQNDVAGRRHEGTGKWFLEADLFKAWLDGTEKALWCPGIRTFLPLFCLSVLTDWKLVLVKPFSRMKTNHRSA